MSPTNWSFCPNCKDLYKKAVKEALLRHENELTMAYGRVSKEDYEKLLARDPMEDKEVVNLDTGEEETMREDYYIGIDDEGEFVVYYRAECTRCPLVFEFTHHQPWKKGDES